jgi:hypothetical protein
MVGAAGRHRHLLHNGEEPFYLHDPVHNTDGGSRDPIAVLFWSTGMQKALPVERKGPLAWVETRGIEPRTSCLQSRRSTN